MKIYIVMGKTNDVWIPLAAYKERMYAEGKRRRLIEEFSFIGNEETIENDFYIKELQIED